MQFFSDLDCDYPVSIYDIAFYLLVARRKTKPQAKPQIYSCSCTFRSKRILQGDRARWTIPCLFMYCKPCKTSYAMHKILEELQKKKKLFWMFSFLICKNGDCFTAIPNTSDTFTTPEHFKGSTLNMVGCAQHHTQLLNIPQLGFFT